MQNPEVYLYGMVLGTHSFLLKDGFLKPDEYSEIQESYFLPGGETGTAATVLSSLGVSVRMDGTWIGTEVAPMLKAFYADKSVDLDSLCFVDDDPGIMDYVVIAGLVRSPMGRFQALFSSSLDLFLYRSCLTQSPGSQSLKSSAASSRRS